MTTINFDRGTPLSDWIDLLVDVLDIGTVVEADGTYSSLTIQSGNTTLVLTGTGIVVAGGALTGGTISEIQLVDFGNTVATVNNVTGDVDASVIEGLRASVTDEVSLRTQLAALFDIEFVEAFGSSGGDELFGGSQDDNLQGNAGDDFLYGGDGSDNLDGGFENDDDGDFDILDYRTEELFNTGTAQAVNVNLATSVATDTYGKTDTVWSFELVRGTNVGVGGGPGQGDTFVGQVWDDRFQGLGGDDTINGSGGEDWSDYSYDNTAGGTAGVTVDLETSVDGDGNVMGTATDGFGDTDTLSNIENVQGTDDNDSITGSSGRNKLLGGGGNDNLSGEGDEDELDGGTGEDSLLGGDGQDRLDGGADNDSLDGGTGNDRLQGGDGDDVVDGGDGHDEIDGGLATTTEAADGETGFDRIFFFNGSSGTDGVTFVVTDATAGSGSVTGLFQGMNNVNTTFSNMERIGGTEGNDTFTVNSYLGTDESQTRNGFDAVLSVVGGKGDDLFTDTLGGRIVVDYEEEQWSQHNVGDQYGDGFDGNGDPAAEPGVIVNLSAGTQAGVASGTGLDTFGDTDSYSALVKYFSLTDADDQFWAGANGVDVDARRGDDSFVGGIGSDRFNGGEGDDTADGGDGRDELQGEQGSDVLNGGIGGDRLRGGDGDDTLHGDAGDDEVEGDSGDDYVGGDAGHDRLRGGNGSDTLEGSTGNDELEGDEGDDLLYGGNLANTLVGSGNDRLRGGYGVDTLYGGDGDDELEAGDGRDDPNSLTNIDKLYGGDGADRVRGGNLRDELNGGNGNDEVEGRDGNDILNGDAGNDRLRGDNGNDVLFGGVGLDRLEGGNDTDTLHGGAADDSLDGGNGNDTLNGDVGNDNLYGGGDNGNDTLNGGDNDDQLDGDGGDDVLDGGNGNDRLNGGNGNDTLIGAAGVDRYFGGQGNDTYVLGATATAALGDIWDDDGIDTISTLVTRSLQEGRFNGNFENIFAAATTAAGQTLTGTDGANVLGGNLAATAQTLNGLLGNDTYNIGVGDTINEAVNGGTMDVANFFGANGQTYTIAAGVYLEQVTLAGNATTNATGNAFNNILIGNGVANTLNGGDGNDTLNGMAGLDTLIGGNGNDTYVINRTVDGATTDTVTETGVVASTADLVQFTASAAGQSYTLGGTVENLTVLGALNTNGVGNALANIFTGNVGVNSFNGGDGNDTYNLQNTNDTVVESNAAAAGGTDTVNFNGIAGQTYILGATNVERLTLTGAAATNGTGNALGNVITGNAVANILNGAGGLDTLTGGLGNDFFVLNTAIGATNVDVITDLNEAGDDLVRLENTGVGLFNALAAGALAVGAYTENAAGTATAPGHRIIYEIDTGKLWYDSDGNGAAVATHFATLDANKAAVYSNADFFVI